jgi:hypothetical protein
MQRLIVLLTLLGAACGGGSAGPQTPVPQSVNAALEQFLSAVKANDLSRMGGLWGTDRGPASQWMKPDELRQRLSVIQKYLDHTGYRIVEGPLAVPSRNDLRTYRVDLQRAGGCTQVVQVDVIRTRSGGWLVFDPHLESAGNPASRCQSAGSGTRP